MKRLYILYVFMTLWATSHAQIRGVIVDIESGLPIRDVKVYTNNNKVVTSNWLGEFSIYSQFQSATLSHGKYMALTLKSEEMSDTIYMLPKMRTLDEVVVWGKRPFMSQSPKKMTEDAALYSQGGGMSFDLFSLFKKSPMNRSQRKKHDEIIKNY